MHARSKEARTLRLVLPCNIPFHGEKEPRLTSTLARFCSANATQQAWLNSESEEEDDANDVGDVGGDDGRVDRQPQSARGRRREAEEDRPAAAAVAAVAAARTRSASPSRKRGASADPSRPRGLNLSSPQWVDFKRRRSSLLSLHFGNGSLIRATASTPEPRPVARLGSAARLRPRAALSGLKRSLHKKQKAAHGGAGGSGGRDGAGDVDLEHAPRAPRAPNLPSFTTTERSGAISEDKAEPDDVRGEIGRPAVSGAVSMELSDSQPRQRQLMPRYHSGEKQGGVGSTVAGPGRHPRPSGNWALENSAHDSSFSGFSSISEIDGSKSSMEVHDFLEESAGSANEGEDGRSSRGEPENGGGDLGGVDGGRAGCGGDGSAGGNDLDAQDIRFLVEGKKLRDVLLAVEDLHFSEYTKRFLFGVKCSTQYRLLPSC